MKIDSLQVEKVALLSNLKLSDHELEVYADHLSNILDYIAQLNQVQTDQVKPTFNINPISQVTQPDQVEESLSTDEALSNALKTEAGFFVAEGVFADE